MFLSFFQLKGLTRSSWGQISWWRSSLFLNILLSSRAQMRVNPLSDQSESWMVLDGVKLISFLCTVCLNKVLQSEPVDFARRLWASALVFLHRFLRLPADWVGRWLVHVWLHMAVYTCTLCSCKQQRREREKKQWEGWPQWCGGYIYLYTKWCMRRPWTTQLDPVSVNRITPPSNTHEHSRENWLAPPTLFSLLFTPLLSSSSPFALKIYCIPRAEHFLNYRLEVS